MEGAILIAAPVLIAVAEVFIAFANGIAIWRASSQHMGPRRVALRLLALNLCEPLVNVVAIILLLRFAAELVTPVADWRLFSLRSGLMITAPMAVLLLPLAWAFGADPLCRQVNARLAALGALRWGVTALTFMQPLIMLIGLIVLGFSIRWVKRQAYEVLMPAYRAVGVGPDGVMVGELADFAQAAKTHSPTTQP